MIPRTGVGAAPFGAHPGGRTSPMTVPRRSRADPGEHPGSPTACLRRVRDYAEVRAEGIVDRQAARAALRVYDVDEAGARPSGPGGACALWLKISGAVRSGLSTLAVAVGEQPDTVEEVCEPFLLRVGLLLRTPRGRVATDCGVADTSVVQLRLVRSAAIRSR